MGGYGSGRTGHKQKIGQYLSLDVNWLHREGCLNVGGGYVFWSREGEETGRVGYRTDDHGFNLFYRSRQNGGDWESLTQTISITRADCIYGGTRPYFQCSGAVNGQYCARRVGKVFAAGKYFLCRHCYNLAYDSQSEPSYNRMLRRANKIREAQGGHPGTAHAIAPKPKGMWERTYQRKRFEIWWRENQADQMFIAKFAHILSEADVALLE